MVCKKKKEKGVDKDIYCLCVIRNRPTAVSCPTAVSNTKAVT